ncbi:MAG: efflux RND transporter periplasmic adaptor subunit, partial [Chromatiales bacterium]|nr:efflux RND transporter periplasmic adaptor subunit [Chromatiales bacterium]
MKKTFVFTLLWLLASHPASAEEQLAVANAEMREIPKTHRLDGVVEAVNQTTVSAQTQGQIEAIFFDIDDFVEKDALIIQLKDTQQRASLDQAQAEVKSANARLQEAQDEFTRVKGVYSKQLVSQSAMDKANTALKQALAQRDAAKAGLKQAREQLEYTKIRAPYSGIVTERHVELGEIATPGQKMMSGISLDQLRVNVDVPQSLVAAIRRSGEAHVQQPGNGYIKAEKLTIFPYADSASNTFKVRLYLPDGSKNMFPGMYVKTAFVIGHYQRLLIPAEAMVYRSEVTGVYVVNKSGKITFRHIRTGGKAATGEIIVLAGLDAGEQV